MEIKITEAVRFPTGEIKDYRGKDQDGWPVTIDPFVGCALEFSEELAESLIGKTVIIDDDCYAHRMYLPQEGGVIIKAAKEIK